MPAAAGPPPHHRPGTPGRPLHPSVHGANGAIDLAWDPPRSSGRSPVLTYTAAAITVTHRDAGACFVTTTFCTIPLLPNDKRYVVVIFASNSQGAGKRRQTDRVRTTDQVDCGFVGEYANLSGCDLRQADLAGADLTGATLTGANIDDADLSGTILNAVVSGGLQGQPASLPAGWTLIDGYLLGADADVHAAHLAGVELDGADLAGTNFSNADLTGAEMSGADLNRANLSDATLTDTDLVLQISPTPISLAARTSLPINWSAPSGRTPDVRMTPTATTMAAHVWGI